MVGDKFGEEIECPYDQKAEKYIINFYRFQNEPKIPPLAIAKDLDVHCEADYPPQSKTEPIVVTILRPDIDKQYESIPANSSSHTPLIHLGGRGKNAYENKKSIYKRQFSRIQKYEEYELENGFSIYKDFSEYRDRNPIPIYLTKNKEVVELYYCWAEVCGFESVTEDSLYGYSVWLPRPKYEGDFPKLHEATLEFVKSLYQTPLFPSDK